MGRKVPMAPFQFPEFLLVDWIKKTKKTKLNKTKKKTKNRIYNKNRSLIIPHIQPYLLCLNYAYQTSTFPLKCYRTFASNFQDVGCAVSSSVQINQKAVSMEKIPVPVR